MNLFYEIYSVIIAVLCSIIASYLFWYYSFRKTNVKIRFSDQIEKSPDLSNKEKYRYRLKLINIGPRDLIEVSFIAKLSIKRKRTSNNCFLYLGHEEIIPILQGSKFQNKMVNRNKGCSWTLQFHETEDFFQEFSKSVYPENIRDAAQNNKLTLDDIFAEFGEKASITVYSFGYDSVTGARKMFVSPQYSINEIQTGLYLHNTQEMDYKTYIDHILTVGKDDSNEKQIQLNTQVTNNNDSGTENSSS